MHYRKRIRSAVAEALRGATAAGANVFTSRARPVLEIIQRREAVLSVYTADESSAKDGTGYQMERKLQVTIEGIMGGGDDLDDALDALAEQVEAVIDADPRLAGLLSDDMVLTATSTEISARGNLQVGAFRLDYECSYLTTLVTDDPLPGYPPRDLNVNINAVGDAYVDAAGLTGDLAATTSEGVFPLPDCGGDA